MGGGLRGFDVAVEFEELREEGEDECEGDLEGCTACLVWRTLVVACARCVWRWLEWSGVVYAPSLAVAK